MAKRPDLKSQLGGQRAATTKSATVAETFRKGDEEPRVRTSLYLPASLAKRLKLQAVEEGVRANDIVVRALSEHLDVKTS